MATVLVCVVRECGGGAAGWVTLPWPEFSRAELSRFAFVAFSSSCFLSDSKQGKNGTPAPSSVIIYNENYGFIMYTRSQDDKITIYNTYT